MAEGTSVGTIFLDLRIFSHVKEQLNDIANSANRQAKESFDRVGKTMQESISKPMENLDKVMKKPLESVKAQVKQTSDELDNIVARAMDRLKTSGSVKMETPRVAKLTGSKLASDPTEFMNNWDPVKLKLREVQEEAKNTVREATKLPKAAEQTAKAFDKVKASVKASGDSVKQNITHTLQSAQKRTKGLFSGVSKGFHRLKRNILSPFKAVFLTAGLYAAFRGLKSLMTAAGEQSKQFTKSLNAVKANLSVAFMPIIQAIMPALNTLMAGLAKVTKSIAAFISGLFGKTYAQSVAAANKLQQVQNKAQKTKGMLAGFDELNVIDNQQKDEGGIDYGALDTGGTQAAENLANKVKDTFFQIKDVITGSPVFQWMKDKVADAVQFTGERLNAYKKAFDDLKPTFKSIGESASKVAAKLWDFWRPIADSAWEAYKDVIRETDKLIIKLVDSVVRLYDKWLKLYSSILDFLKRIGFLDYVLTQIKIFINFIKDIIVDVLKWFQEKIDAWELIIGGILDFLTGIFLGDWELAWQGLQDVFKGFQKDMEANGNLVMNVLDDIKEYFSKTIENIINFASTQFEIIKRIFLETVNKIVEYFSELPYKIGEKTGEITANLMKWATEDVPEVIDKVVDWFRGLPDRIWKWLQGAYVKCKDWIADVRNYFEIEVPNLIDDVANWFSELPSKIWDGMKSGFETLKQGFKDVFKDLQRGFNVGFSKEMNVNIRDGGSRTPPKRFASGGVVHQPTLGLMGEYANAKSDPEIISPESKMRDVFSEGLAPMVVTLAERLDKVIEAILNTDSTIILDGETISQNTIKRINNETRRTGKAPILV